jgi:hypothetical protein
MEAIGEASIETVLVAGQRVASKLKLRQPLMTHELGQRCILLEIS